ncbi:MAG: CDP-glycerol--poly(glycerophosphate) glycerophosphotransferase [Alistipes sp.]|nr:CDP-glycerol--poly(glycerophosphate) glycerophosphotransferase [Alistipes sp.]
MADRKRYLLYVSLPYAYSIMRPLQEEIRKRGDDAAWFIEDECPDLLVEGEVRLRTFAEVAGYAPVAVFAPGNHIPDFFPGVKVSLSHGYAINKRGQTRDDHFTVRGWFDIYCTQGESTTPQFRELERKLRFFRVYETGWTKADTLFAPHPRIANERKTVLYSSTFTRSLTSTPILADEIERMVASGRYDWIFMFHPKLTDESILSRYRSIAERYPNALYLGNTFDGEAMHRADVMLCDSSSIITEFMFLDKPVVTFRNSQPDRHLIDVRRPEDVEPALERALQRPEELMKAVRAFTMFHEPHRDCRCSARVLDAVDDFLLRGHKGLKRKPLNLVRRIKLRRKMGYPLFKDLFRR